MTIGEFAWAAFAYCTLMGASETSGARTRAHNDRVGGVQHSAHLVGLARDVVYDELPPLAEREEWAKRLGLLVLDEGDHDHLQPLDWRAG